MHCLAPLLPLGAHRWLAGRYAERVIRDRSERLLPTWVSGWLRDDLLDRHLRLCRDAERARRFSSPARESEYRLLYPPEVARHPVPWSLEVWRPFADRRLHEFLFAIPPEQKSAPLSPEVETYAGAKRLARDGMGALLPESIRARSGKTLFTSVLQHEVARQWPLYEQVFGPTGQSEIVDRGYVDRALIWSRLLELRDGGERPDVVYLMQMVGLETWLRTFRLPRARLVTTAPPSTARLSGPRSDPTGGVRSHLVSPRTAREALTVT
jgi:asparagine synthase (glutamine-hydrolysing)